MSTSSVDAGPTIFGFSQKTALLMAFNFFSSVAIVFANKFVSLRYGYNYACFVTALHFVATTIGVRICLHFKMYEVKPLNQMDVLPITVAFCCFVVFNNLSLQYNSVGFYQLMKVLTTPVVVLLQKRLYNMDVHPILLNCLVLIIAGVIIATVSDITLSAVGLFWSTAGLLATAFYQLLIADRQKALRVDALQLLHYQAPQSALIVLAMTPFLDDMLGGRVTASDPVPSTGLLFYKYSLGVYCALAFACFLAFCVNLSTFLVIGATSPVTYQVLGHFKLVLILVSGVIFLGEDSNPIRMVGMVMAFCGIVAYTEVKRIGADKIFAVVDEATSPDSSKGKEKNATVAAVKR